mgnify:FL=1
MKKLLKINPQYPISVGLILMGIGGIFFEITSDIGLGITFIGSFMVISGSIIGFIQYKKNSN